MRELARASSLTGRRGGAAASWWRPVIGALSPAGARGRLTILIFHRVHPRPDELFPNEMHAASFLERMHWVRSWFNVLPLDEAVVALRRGTLPARALAITFDDGYADNAVVALPILRQLGLPATFFIATDYLDGGRMWNDTVIEVVRRTGGPHFDLTELGMGVRTIRSPQERRVAIDAILAQLKYLPPDERQARVDAIAARIGAAPPDDLMMTHGQLREVAAAGMGIGAHTASHPILARLDDEAAKREIAGGRETLQGIIGQAVTLFAYPNGKPNIDYTATHVRMAGELGFMAAVSTARGAACTERPLFELPRYTPWGSSASAWGARLARNLLAHVETASV